MSLIRWSKQLLSSLEWRADGYITKSFSHVELVAWVRAKVRRITASSLDQSQGTLMHEAAGLDIDLFSRTVTRHGETISLSPLEYSILHQLINDGGRAMPLQSLITKVWGQEYVEEVDYLEPHIDRLRTMLKDDSQNPELIHTQGG